MKALVTGGGGFLGLAVVRQLLARGDEVASFSRGHYPALEALGVRCLQGDLQDQAAVSAACRGMDVVFHVAARAGHWGPFEDYYAPNVTGTENVIAGCREHGVPRLVYTSSPSVVFGGGPLEGADESTPYPGSWESPYPHTKALGEQRALAAAGGGLLTVSLRPHLIIGPGDRHLIPALLRTARRGLFPQVGDGTNRVDLTYVEDVARAHLLAADRLTPGSPVAGQAYFISQGEPVLLWPWIRNLLARLGYPPIRLKVSLRTARALGGAMERAWRALPLPGEPKLTRFLASELAQSHWFNIGRARRDLGYSPQKTMDEVLEIILPGLREI